MTHHITITLNQWLISIIGDNFFSINIYICLLPRYIFASHFQHMSHNMLNQFRWNLNIFKSRHAYFIDYCQNLITSKPICLFLVILELALSLSHLLWSRNACCENRLDLGSMILSIIHAWSHYVGSFLISWKDLMWTRQVSTMAIGLQWPFFTKEVNPRLSNAHWKNPKDV